MGEMMTKGLAALVAAFLLAGLAPGAALAAVNSVTPSTNDANKANGWAYVDVTVDPGMATLTFHSTRPFWSCFEWRTDGDTSQRQSPHNPNTDITDGLYDYTCVNNSVDTRVVHPVAYVEVRMVFGAERDERFDWTRFDVPSKCIATGFVRDGIDLTAVVIDPTAPLGGEVDATGCNIGVYFSPGSDGVVDGAEIFGANYYGVLVNAAHANIVDSAIHDIGESPLNGAQHGIGVMYTTFNHPGQVTGTEASGLLADSRITNYQKGGVVITGDGAGGARPGRTRSRARGRWIGSPRTGSR